MQIGPRTWVTVSGMLPPMPPNDSRTEREPPYRRVDAVNSPQLTSTTTGAAQNGTAYEPVTS